MSDSDSRAPLEEAHFRRLLVAIDGSGNAELALAAAVTATRQEHGLLTLIVVAPHVMQTTSLGGTGVSPERLQQQADDEAQRALRDAAERLPDDVSTTQLFRQGRPGAEIVAETRTGRYDAVVLGARGVGRIGALLGSVSQYVLHHAEIPVIVVHAPPRSRGA